jgi:hypothetical protein
MEKIIRSITLAAILISSLMLCAIPAAAEKPVWVSASGEAIQGEVETPKEVIERAMRDAQNKAIEQACGVFLKSHTVVHNSQVADDLIYAAVRGKIKNMEIIDAGWNKDNRSLYLVKIKALVEPVYPEKGEGLSAKLHLSKAELRQGEEVDIFFETSSECYVYLFSVAADGSVTLLFPNSRNQENKTEGKKAYKFPAPESGIKLKAMFLPDYRGKAAEETIKLIATKKKENLLPLGFKEGMFQAYDANSTGMISDLIRKLNQIDPTEWTEATARYIIKGK